MVRLDEEQEIQYLKRSYSAVDGLWFLKVEETSGFDKALEIDNEVWNVMPKIQARFLKSVFDLDKGLEALEICVSEKLRLDGIDFLSKNDGQSLIITIKRCHWHELMVNSNREHLSPRVGETICSTEYSGWAKEFGDDISFDMNGRICCGEKECVLRFRK